MTGDAPRSFPCPVIIDLESDLLIESVVLIYFVDFGCIRLSSYFAFHPSHLVLDVYTTAGHLNRVVRPAKENRWGPRSAHLMIIEKD